MQKRFDAIIAELLRAIDSQARGQSLLVAVSGGVDSMTLAHLCLHSGLCLSSGRVSQSDPGFRMTVAHCNFHLRGEESDGDEALVREWCAVNGVEIHVADFDTVSYAKEHGLSIEMAARELRYNWFARLCREHGFSGVAVAHNANDNAETLFLNLLRGTGLRGLCGMRPLSCVPENMSPKKADRPAGPSEGNDSTASLTGPENGIPLLRPLLSFTREQILGYARANGISWREDSTNGESDCKRNLLRNEVFPLFARINPSFIETLNREMRHFSSANAIVEDAIPDLIVKGEPIPCIDGSAFCDSPEDRISIRELLSYKSWPYILYSLLQPYGFNSSTIGNVEVVIRRTYIERGGVAGFEGGRVFFSDKYRLYNTSEELVITARTAIPPQKWTTVTGPGLYNAGKNSFSVEILERNKIECLKAPKGTLFFDADTIVLPFIVREWNYGDWICPLGMGGRRKKISDLFVDLKYDYIKKNNALFIERFEDACNRNDTDGAHVYALLGERIDDAVKVTPSTTKVLKITLL